MHAPHSIKSPTRSNNAFNAMKVFCATQGREREMLAERVNQWVAARKRAGAKVVDYLVRQSSDSAFHCLSIIVFLIEP